MSAQEQTEALQRLRDGNARFVAHVRSAETLARQLLRAELALGQKPFAVLLGCSDSRVPAELVFDQGLGDLFVIRVAGNIVAPSQIGSVEFAVEAFGTQLVVVLGHTLCGAITATLSTLLDGATPSTRNLNSIVNRIRPALEGWVTKGSTESREELRTRAVRANVRASVSQLRHGSELLEARVLAGELLIVGAEYDLETGVVDFFEIP
ncbi:carbonic anhydrase [Aggregicoccus sp. 17bor-14]|uniref:carbonic anhydrase n=1 Tax=Myxococcaceae TaxID=31 RepID=UPI00129CC9FA|nr:MULTISPECIES: carbonic anhydrase [Myxococcaceae]MBF5045068.1 carbonic anhydrase [Simulacricoccus sp. 17bor-14]MRI90810.1 carbonic anhydrase [Aggregicoccus sp. 17bor-14]